MAQAVMGEVIAREALVLAFNDVFRVMCWMFVAALAMVPFTRAPAPDAGPPPADAH